LTEVGYFVSACEIKSPPANVSLKSAMNPPPISTPAPQQKKDTEHLRLLSVFHFVFAGFGALGVIVMVVQFAIMQRLFSNPEIWKSEQNPPPKEVVTILLGVFVFVSLLIVLGLALNLLSAIFIRKRRHRLFSLIVAGLNCLQVPLGTALGVFTFMVLTRESVQQEYAAAAHP
jgi:ABC-type phosphate transport system permease subunit